MLNTFDFNTSSERPLSKLSEINVIGPTELMLRSKMLYMFNATCYSAYLLPTTKAQSIHLQTYEFQYQL